MAPIFVSGASRVFAPGCLSLFKVRTDGNQLRGGLRASTSATNSREVFGHFRGHSPSTYRKPLSSSSHTVTRRKLRFVFTTSSLPPCQRRTSHYATDIDFEQLSPSRHGNKRLNPIEGSQNVAFCGILRLFLDLQSSFACLTNKAALCYTAHNEKGWS